MFQLEGRKPHKVKGEMLCIPVFENEFRFPSFLSDFFPAGTDIPENLVKMNFTGKLEKHCAFASVGDSWRIIVFLGAGRREKWNLESARKLFGRAVRIAAKARRKQVHLYWDQNFPTGDDEAAFFREAVSAAITANFRFEKFRGAETRSDDPIEVEEFNLFYPDAGPEIQTDVEAGKKLGEAVNFASYLAELPGNELTPDAFVNEIKELASAYSWKISVVDKKQMKKEGLGALLAVASGSAREAYLAIAEYRHPAAKQTLAVVGKGVTFDSGGISIKPSKDMDKMKYDMCGAAAAVAALRWVSEMKLPVNLICVTPLVENLPSMTPTRPGDIVRAYDGATIEVLNTDAEGRLILADALAYLKKNYSPDFCIDLATLTGAVVVALGHQAAGLFSNRDELIEKIRKAGEISGDRVWPMPVWKEYGELMKSKVADIANISGTREAGSVTAAMFLKKFVGDMPWVHLDIAGTAFDAPEKSYVNGGASGFGVRLLSEWILAESNPRKFGNEKQN